LNTSKGNGNQKALHFSKPPERVVSLVPSMTESLCDLGFGHSIVGITDYCIHPADMLADVPRIGGPRTPRIDEVYDLKPDLIIANQEENNRADVEAMEARDLPVWVSFPQNIDMSMEILWTLVELFRSEPAVLRLKTLEVALDWARLAAQTQENVRCFCPIWQDQTDTGQTWWMTINRLTYTSDLMELIGADNCFANRDRRYPLMADIGDQEPEEPGERDTRYPRVSVEEVLEAAPDLIILPDEPFNFDEPTQEKIITLLAETPAVKLGKVVYIDGSLLTWHGTRLDRALRELPNILATL
jgi:ABC-type Fe3+-hydroxamate transport system substrate-binding protein